MAMDRLQTSKHGWTFIRINYPVVGSDEEALDSIRAFARSISSPLAGILNAGVHKVEE